MSGKKWYGVRVGVTPGVYDSWDTCSPVVVGVKGAVYKSFGSKEEAEDYVKGADTPCNKWYGVRVGTVPGVYGSWNACSPAVTGIKGAVYKSFGSKEEAENYVKGFNTQGKKWYEAQTDTTPEVYDSWDACSSAAADVKGEVYKSFANKAEAEVYMHGES